MIWDKIKNKKTLIDQIRAAVRKNTKEVVRRRIHCWTHRVYQMLQRRCEYVF
jgi:hypothetical protein